MSGRGDWTAGADLAAVGIDPKTCQAGQGDAPERKLELVGMDLTIRVEEARISLYLDDAGELVIDEYCGRCELRALLAALERALGLVDGFRSL